MIKKLLMTLGAILVVATGLAEPPSTGLSPTGGRGVKLTREQINTIKAVHPDLLHRKTNIQTTGDRGIVKMIDGSQDAIRKVNPSGSSVQGWRTVDEYSGFVKGWYELGIDGSENLLWEYHDPNWVDDGWSDEPDFPFRAAFMRNGIVYGFHSEVIFYWLIWGHGAFTLDGEILEYHEYGEDLDIMELSTYVISCAYDEKNDMVYAYTLNPEGTGYMLQSVNPETWDFSVVDDNVSIEDICPGMAYNPVDGKIYGMTADARFVTLDTSSGSLKEIARFDLGVTTALEGMTYSPLDKVFFFVYSEGGNSSVLYTIDPLNPKLEMRSVLTGTIQYRILVTPDVLAEPMSPKTPEIVSINFPDGSLSGKAVVRMPSETFGGEKIEKDKEVSVIVKVDDVVTDNVSAEAGESVEISFSDLSEGLHKFYFTAECDGLRSAAVSKDCFVGYGTPEAPSNIELTDGLVTWDFSGMSVDGGYIDVENIRFNVYLNGNRINESPVAGRSYMLELPDGDFQIYTAEVEADNRGHISARGISNYITHGNPIPLPFSIAPTEGQAGLATTCTDGNPDSDGIWQFAQNMYGEPCFNCYGNSFLGDDSDEWLIMPPIYMPDTDMLIEIECEVMANPYVNAGDDVTEILQIFYGENQTVDSMKEVASWDDIYSDEWRKLKAWLHPAQGCGYIAFKTELSDHITDLCIRNISIHVSDRPVYTPSGVLNLSATAMPGGELKASVCFDMPENSMDGKPLEAKELTAVVKSDVETITVTGAPGSSQIVEISTADGLNTISIVVCNDAEGLESSTKVFTGIDIPKPLENLKAGHTEDYAGLHLEWDAPQEGINGGYVDPADVEYAICVRNYDTWEWEIRENLGNTLSYDYIPELVSQLSLAEVGILTFNEKGTSGLVRIVQGCAGIPYTLPMEDGFKNGYFNLQPIVAERPDPSYSVEFSFTSQVAPDWTEITPPYGTGAFVAQSSGDCKARIVLPAFSTENVAEASLEMPVYTGPDAAEIRIYASGYETAEILLGSISDTENMSYDMYRFALPSEMMGKKWVEIKIDAIFDGEDEKTASFAQYKVKTFLKDDFAVTKLDSSPFAYVDDKVTVSVTVENVGNEVNTLPDVVLSFNKDGKNVGTATAECISDKSSLGILETAVYEAEWIPGAEACGDILIEASLKDSDMDNSNNRMSAMITLDKGNLPVVTDLSAAVSDNGIDLTWTAPAVETGFEGFENIPSYAFGDRIGNLKTVRLDDYETQVFGYRFPFDVDPKAWQVIDIADMLRRIEESECTDEWFSAASGNKVAMAATPYSILWGENLTSDRWLITPRLKGGSKVSFMLTSALTSYVEPVEIMYSSTDDSVESFVSLDKLKILSSGWRKYEYTLPADASYFAIRYLGVTHTNYFVLLDDLCFEPSAGSPSVEGYDIYRNGEILAENVSAGGSWTDSSPLVETSTRYNVVPVIKTGEDMTRGMMSNTAYVDSSSIKDAGISSAAIAGKDGYIEIRNLDGVRVDVYSVDGKRVAYVLPVSDVERITVAKGVYMVVANGVRVKVIVK